MSPMQEQVEARSGQRPEQKMVDGVDGHRDPLFSDHGGRHGTVAEVVR
jgi:hypothetical protein